MLLPIVLTTLCGSCVLGVLLVGYKEVNQPAWGCRWVLSWGLSKCLTLNFGSSHMPCCLPHRSLLYLMIAIRPEAFRSTSCPNNKIVHTCGPFSPKGHATNAKLIICFLKKTYPSNKSTQHKPTFIECSPCARHTVFYMICLMFLQQPWEVDVAFWSSFCKCRNWGIKISQLLQDHPATEYLSWF